jgi:hypothetical protein
MVILTTKRALYILIEYRSHSVNDVIFATNVQHTKS